MNKPLNPHTLYLTVSQVADRYGVSNDTVWRWSRAGDLPKPVKVGPNVTRWRLSELMAHDATLKTFFAVDGFELPAMTPALWW